MPGGGGEIRPDQSRRAVHMDGGKGSDAPKQAPTETSNTRGGRGGFSRGGRSGPTKDGTGGGPPQNNASDTIPMQEKSLRGPSQPKHAAKIVLGKGVESKISPSLMEDLAYLPFFPSDNGRHGTQTTEVLRMANESLDTLLAMPLHKSVSTHVKPCFCCIFSG